MSAAPIADDTLRPLVARGIAKSYGSTRALRGVDFALAQGEIHALLGENGAGKSTLVRILSGVEHADRGDVLVAGERAHFAGPRDAMAVGIVTVPQELRLVPALSVAENIVLGQWPTWGGLIVQRRLRQEARRALETIGVDLPLDLPVRSLGFAERQLIVIARALRRAPNVLILDEPTAALARREVERLLQILDRLKLQGVALLYVSHRLQEVVDIADRCTILRDGEVVDVAARGHFDVPHLVTKMAGRDPALADPVAPPVGDTMLEGGGLALRSGQVLGLTGLLGSGARETLDRFFGLGGGVADVRVDARRMSLRSPRAAIRAGFGLVPGERAKGLVMGQSVRDNIALPNLARLGRPWWVRRKAGDRLTRDLIALLDIRPANPALPVSALSGGNQQKVIFAKWLAKNVDLLLLDEPTHGVDILAKMRIHALVREFAARGGGVVMHSTDIDELLATCHAILAIKDGRVGQRLERGADFEANRLRETIGG